MRINMITAVIAIFTLAFVGNAVAAPVFYSEDVDGDIGSGAEFTLDFGVNTISGRVSGAQTTLGFDSDFFRAFLPANSILASIELEVTPIGANGIAPAKFQYRIEDGATQSINTFSGGNFTLDLAIVALFLRNVGLNTIQFETIADYQISFDVMRAPTEVPLPAAFFLFIAGLGVIRSTARHKILPQRS